MLLQNQGIGQATFLFSHPLHAVPDKEAHSWAPRADILCAFRSLGESRIFLPRLHKTPEPHREPHASSPQLHCADPVTEYGIGTVTNLRATFL